MVAAGVDIVLVGGWCQRASTRLDTSSYIVGISTPGPKERLTYVVQVAHKSLRASIQGG